MATKSDKRPCIAKRAIIIKNVTHSMFFTTPAIQVVVPKGKSIDVKFCTTKIPRKLYKYFENEDPQ
jgi:hypothetical protein